jgi:hypothetical protein
LRFLLRFRPDMIFPPRGDDVGDTGIFRVEQDSARGSRCVRQNRLRTSVGTVLPTDQLTDNGFQPTNHPSRLPEVNLVDGVSGMVVVGTQPGVRPQRDSQGE